MTVLVSLSVTAPSDHSRTGGCRRGGLAGVFGVSGRLTGFWVEQGRAPVELGEAGVGVDRPHGTVAFRL